MDPVTLGLCSQLDLDFEVARANKDRPQTPDAGQMLAPAEITTGPRAWEAEPEAPTRESVFSTPSPALQVDEEDEIDVDSVFAKLKDLKTKE
jgi:hypothetical protein